ncbi:alpha/beta fold hydrolase [Gordonia sp. SL306]|uniref:alpha/beta fold hydrolase n=1 Tax=Gordonia sp. SL306 TaxID=2995145 RepID=UPI00226EF927|nr:alpha/beta fold hydrolase [Gordonia sp. SL306]WAC54345.1 alpha/beta fold hydrolase [Gordonia sp. SL306]
MTRNPAAVLIHGAWAGPWVWDLVTPYLAEAGIDTRCPDLPGSGTWEPFEAVALPDLVDHVVGELGDIEGPMVVIGHSGGGVVATAVAERLCRTGDTRPAGLGVVAGMMLPAGMDFGELCDAAGLTAPVGISAFTEPTADGRGTIVGAAAAAAVFFHDAPPALSVNAARRLVPQLESARLIAPDWTPDGAGALPRLYVEATRDRSVPLAAQRAMQRLSPGARIVTLESDHAPQLSRPAELSRILAEFVLDVRDRAEPSRSPVPAGADR